MKHSRWRFKKKKILHSQDTRVVNHTSTKLYSPWTENCACSVNLHSVLFWIWLNVGSCQRSLNTRGCILKGQMNLTFSKFFSLAMGNFWSITFWSNNGQMDTVGPTEKRVPDKQVLFLNLRWNEMHFSFPFPPRRLGVKSIWPWPKSGLPTSPVVYVPRARNNLCPFLFVRRTVHSHTHSHPSLFQITNPTYLTYLTVTPVALPCLPTLLPSSYMGSSAQDGENVLWPNGLIFWSFVNCSEEILSVTV